MSDRPKPQLTLLGMPAPSWSRQLDAVEADPFPLTPYRDVHVYTPSRTRPHVEATPVMLPPPPTAKTRPTVVMKRPQLEPSSGSMLLAGAACCLAIALLALLSS